METDNEQDKPKKFVSGSTYVFLTISLLLIAIGGWLFFTGQDAYGINYPARYMEHERSSARLSGKAVIIMGFVFGIFPLSDFVRDFRRKL